MTSSPALSMLCPVHDAPEPKRSPVLDLVLPAGIVLDPDCPGAAIAATNLLVMELKVAYETCRSLRPPRNSSRTPAAVRTRSQEKESLRRDHRS